MFAKTQVPATDLSHGERLRALQRRASPVRRLTTLLIAVAAAFIGLGATPDPSAAQSVADLNGRTYTFEVSWSALPDTVIARGRIDVRQTRSRYEVSVDARTRLTFPAIDRRDQLDVSGVWNGRGRRPRRFERRGEDAESRSYARVMWTGAGAPTVELAADASAAPTRGRVDPSIVGDAIDPVTYVVEILDRVQASGGRDCAVAGRLFDGVRLIDVRTDVDSVVSADQLNCRLTILSFRGVSNVRRFRAREAATRRIIEFRRDGSDWHPTRLTIETQFGLVTARFVTVFRPLAN